MTLAELTQWHVDQHPELCGTEESTAAYRKAVAETLKGLGYWDELDDRIEVPADMSTWKPEKQKVNLAVQELIEGQQ